MSLGGNTSSRFHSNLSTGRALTNSAVKDISCKHLEVSKEVTKTMGKINKLN